MDVQSSLPDIFAPGELGLGVLPKLQESLIRLAALDCVAHED